MNLDSLNYVKKGIEFSSLNANKDEYVSIESEDHERISEEKLTSTCQKIQVHEKIQNLRKKNLKRY